MFADSHLTRFIATTLGLSSFVNLIGDDRALYNPGGFITINLAWLIRQKLGPGEYTK